MNIILEALKELKTFYEDFDEEDIQIKEIGRNKISLYVRGKFVAWVYVSDTGYIYYLEVKEPYRNNKLGAKLINYAEKYKGGYWFHVEEPNIKAIRFYERLGYEKQPDTDDKYLKLFVKKDRLDDYRKLEKECQHNMRKMLGSLARVNSEINDYNSSDEHRTKFDSEGNQIK